MNENSTLLEICVGTVADAMAAAESGADRIELNTGLALGGLTPSPTMVKQVRSAVACDLIVMNRPRSGNFVYDQHELGTMRGDAEWMGRLGVNGIAFGCLLPDRSIDLTATMQIVDALGDRSAVFHRAFDLVEDQPRALEELIDCGIDRILTSGGCATAIEGCAKIRQLVEQAGDRIEILPGAGIRPDNVRELIKETGCNQVHASLSKVVVSDAEVAAPDDHPIRFVDALALDETKQRQFDRASMQSMFEALGRSR